MSITIEQIDKLLRNPADIHKIQDKLLALPGDSIFAHSVRLGAETDLNECLKMILAQAKDNRPMVERIVGNNLLKEIEQL